MMHRRRPLICLRGRGSCRPSPRANSEEVSGPTLSSFALPRFIATQTAKAQHDHSYNLLVPSAGTDERSASIGRGDLDQAIRTLREGRKRSRAPRSIARASKIFLDGRPDLS
ncbi:hypothetical protein EDB19DRAFT_1102309 [Suillus lakei]|nr:hypothetical protein EDB19DRAFT_1102309 [Suillus lakei]